MEKMSLGGGHVAVTGVALSKIGLKFSFMQPWKTGVAD
jgi:hypothetical protein